MKGKIKKIKTNVKTKLLAIFGTVSGLFGLIGALDLCCVPFVVAFFAIFGISSMFLMQYNSIFLAVGLISISISIVLYAKSKVVRSKK